MAGELRVVEVERGVFFEGEMKRLFLWILAGGILGGIGFAETDAEVARRVVIVVNGAVKESVELGRFYAEKRGVPLENIFEVEAPVAETVGWNDFIEKIFNPLQEVLVKKEWINGASAGKTDAIGRKRYFISGHRISYLVVCKGVPLIIANNPAVRMGPTPAGMPEQYRTNGGAVDSELGLLARSGTAIEGFVTNPLFDKETVLSVEAEKVVKVGRLDGGSFEVARGLVERALEAEKTGLVGRSYVDVGGMHDMGNKWLNEAQAELKGQGFDGDVEATTGRFRAGARFDRPVLYFGWYAREIEGPFAVPGFRFPAGAVALHIHSFSAPTLRSVEKKNWVEGFLERGVTATFGNVAEPYLAYTHEPQLILKSLARGERLGDAAMYSIPVLGWQGICVGDPMYRPFKVSVEEQWEKRKELGAAERGYVVARRMKALAGKGKLKEALKLGEKEESGSVAVILMRAELLRKEKDAAGEKKALLGLRLKGAFTFDELSAAVVGAERLVALKEAKAAMGIWMVVLYGQGKLPEVLRIAWLPKAKAAALAAGNAGQAQRWAFELEELLPKPKPAEGDMGKSKK